MIIDMYTRGYINLKSIKSYNLSLCQMKYTQFYALHSKFTFNTEG